MGMSNAAGATDNATSLRFWRRSADNSLVKLRHRRHGPGSGSKDLAILALSLATGFALATLDHTLGLVDWSRVHESWHVDAMVVGFFLVLGLALVAKLRGDRYATESEDHRRTLVELEESERKWRGIFEASASGTAIVSMRDGRLIAVNGAISEATGYTEQQLLSMSTKDLLHPEDLAASQKRIARLLNGDTSVTRSRTRYLDKAGHTKHALISSAPLGSDGNRPEYLVVQLVDVTEQVAAEQRLQRLIDAKDQLIASVSHEIRTPLSAVVGYAQLLNDEVLNLTDAERREMIATIANQGSDLTNIVEDLVVEARVDDGLLTVASVPVNLLAQARQVLETLDKGTGAESVHLGLTSPRALADPGRVRQIIRNLLTNALRYGGDQVRVSCEEEPDVVSLTVADNGSGVPVADRKRIFEPYQRAHSRPGLTASIGLGLSVSRKLARLMDGDLIYGYSNGWSTFRLELPPVLAIADQGKAEELRSWVTTA